MRTAYRYCDRNQLQTARLLGISRNIVRARLIAVRRAPGVAAPRRGHGAGKTAGHPRRLPEIRPAQRVARQ